MSLEKFPANAHWFLFCNDELFFSECSGTKQLPSTAEIPFSDLKIAEVLRIGTLDKTTCCAVHLCPDQPVAGLSSTKIRQLHGHLPDPHYEFAFRALHLLNWRKNNQYCSSCGGPLHISSTELAAQCAACGNLVFPRISPAIIVAIEKENQILLARSSRFPAGMYSVLAGFVEPGETFEECVKREVNEEVGIEVGDIRYFSSQPWPFPDSLMVGFTAQWKNGDICIDENEIVDANWYTVDSLPPLPGKDSIARKLIDRYIEKQRTIITILKQAGLK